MSDWLSLLFNTSEGGVSSAMAPELLPDNQNAWMLNGQNRGGKPSTRPNIAHRLDMPAGLLQGAEFFSVQNGMIVVSIAGQIYKIRISGNVFSYESIALSFVNSPVIKQVWMEQTVEALVIQDGQSNPIVYDGSTAVRATYGEVPRGRTMAYGNGRLWVAVNGNEIVAGDIRTGVPGSELLFTEATYLTGGGKLFFPSKITGLAFIPVTGQSDYGALLVFSAAETNSIRADITARDDWGKIPGFVTGILRSVGAASQWGIASVNQDLFWRDSNRGIRSIRNALADEAGPGSAPISREVSRLTDYDSQRLLNFCSSIYHDNRLLVTSSPFLMKNGGIGFKNLIALDFAPLSTMSGKSQAAYDGQWNGITFVKLVAGEFQGRNRAFALGTDEYGNNQLWEFGPGDRDDISHVCSDGTADASPWPIQCYIEYPLRDFGRPKNRKQLERFDLWLSDVNGEVSVKVEWRTDNNQKWLTWDEATTCAKTSDASTTAPHVWKNLLPQYRPQFKTFTIPDNIIELVGYAAEVGFAFQIRLSWVGRCKIYKAMVHGSILDDPDYADRTGFSAECVEHEVNGNEITYAIPTEGCATCPSFATEPMPEEIHEGENASFSVDTEYPVDSYQWQVSTDAGSSWDDIVDDSVYSGATTRTLTITAAPIGYEGYLYRAVCFKEGCENDGYPSSSAELTVLPAPNAGLTCESESGAATLCGIIEFTTPSTPPKKYRRKTSSGSRNYTSYFDEGANPCLNPWILDNIRTITGAVQYSAVNCAITDTSTGGIESNSCVSSIIERTRKYNSPNGVCSTCYFFPRKQKVITTNLTEQLEDEDTEDDAIARATPTPGSSCMAYRETRGAGDFSFGWANVAFDINCSGLITGHAYVAHYTLTEENYGGGSPIVTSHDIPFSASGPTQDVGDAIICPTGKQVTVSNPSITPA